MTLFAQEVYPQIKELPRTVGAKVRTESLLASAS
jgi:hypothetical protein